MAPKKDNTTEERIKNLQRDVGKIATIEKKVDEILKRMAKMDVLDRLERPLTEKEERQSSVTILSIQVEVQTSSSHLKVSQTDDPVRNVERVLEHTRSRTEEAELKMPLTRKIKILVFDGEWLLALQQDERTTKYCKDFIALASNAPDLSKNENYQYGNRCKRRYLHLLVGQSDGTEYEFSEDDDEKEDSPTRVPELAELSLYYVVGFLLRGQ
ncbi:unnamed protein product [Cochlearia groenlandica]